MRWGRQWPEREPRPKVRRLTETEQAGIVRSLEKGIAASPVLSAFGLKVRVARGRFYIERQRQNEDSEPYTEVWARISPLAGAKKELLLEKPYRKGTWSEVARGQAAKLIKAIAGDTRGTFHGLGFLDASLRRLGKGQERLPMIVDDQGKFVYTDTGKGCSTAGGVVPLFRPAHRGRGRAIGLVFVSPQPVDCRNERGPDAGAGAVYGGEHVRREFRRHLPVYSAGRAVGGLHHQAERKPDHRPGRGVAGETEVAGVVTRKRSK